MEKKNEIIYFSDADRVLAPDVLPQVVHRDDALNVSCDVYAAGMWFADKEIAAMRTKYPDIDLPALSLDGFRLIVLSDQIAALHLVKVIG